MAYKPINIANLENLNRYEAENDLIFLGFILMINKIKEKTLETITQLSEANIRSIMVTGDNILTAISVAKESSIISKEQKVYLGEMKEGKSGN